METNYVEVVGQKPAISKKEIVKLKSIQIQDFKNIKNLSLNIGKLNDIYGKNKTGKTAVLEAIQFCMQGKKADVNKIRVGAEKAIVKLELMEGKNEINISTSINKAGNITFNAKANGITHNAPRGLIKRLLSVGTFNPRQLLEKEGRLKKLLSLIPIKMTKEDLKVPEMKIKEIPLSGNNKIDFEGHAYNVLESVDKDLRNTRLILGREKDIKEKSYQKRREDLSDSCLIFQKNYNTDPLNLKKSYEEEIKRKERLSVDLGLLEEKITSAKNKVDSTERERIEQENMLVGTSEKITALTKEIEESKEKLKVFQETEKTLQNKISESKKEIKDLVANYEELQKIKEKQEEEHKLCDNKINMSREATNLKKIETDLEEEQKEVIKSQKTHKVFDMLVKEAMPIIRKKVLAPIGNSIKGLKVEDDDITYNGISVDTLSGSEVVELSVKLMALEQRSNLLFINEAECLDEESIKGMDFKDFSSVIIARVGDKPLGGEWNSIEKKGSNGNKNIPS